MTGAAEPPPAEYGPANREYAYVTPPERDRARICFAGTFAGRVVLQDTTVVTLASLQHKRMGGGISRSPLRKFIEVDGQQGHRRGLVVGLAVTHIDEPELHKAIIMTRQYKRLHAGWHVYGEPWSP